MPLSVTAQSEGVLLTVSALCGSPRALTAVSQRQGIPATTPDVARFLEAYARESALSRASLDCRAGVKYGPKPEERMDVFPARKKDSPIFVFIHGGYWRSLDKSFQSFLATELNAAGITVALPNYELCPKISMDGIVMQMVQACAWLWRKPAGTTARR